MIDSHARQNWSRPLALLGLVAALAVFASLSAIDSPATGKEPLVGGQPLFAGWPAGQKPDAVIVFTGQTFGLLQPCGCSRPQVGGLERRATFIDSLKAKGWPVAGIDLGDIHPEKSAVRDQGQLKYLTTMNALREMGYIAVGVGKTDISADMMKLLGSYALQKEQPPFTLAGNAVGVQEGKLVPRDKWFVAGPNAKRSQVEQIEVADVGKVPVGVAGVVGKPLALAARNLKLDPFLEFNDAKAELEAAVQNLANHPKKPQVNVLIYQGTSFDAEKVAKDFPQFNIILCQADDPLPPLLPQIVSGKTHIVQVGHKGQHVGVLGIYKKPGGGFDFKYQLVPMTEDFITPGTEEQARAANKSLPLLEDYAKSVKHQNLLADYPRKPHAAQIRAQGLNPAVNLKYVGSGACKACHAGEYAQWEKTHHGHAMDTLETKAKRPSLRQYDGECVRCHTVGFEHDTGYQDEKKTPHLKHVGCESCHGPGSGHAADPRNKELLELQSPWKQDGAKKMPPAAFIEKMAKIEPFERGKEAINPAVQLLINGVSRTCMQCHDADNDPHFDIYKYWPKVQHTGLAPRNGWPVVPPRK